MPGRVPVLALLAGKSQPFEPGDHSAIAKTPLTGRRRIAFSGIEGDEQADRVHHGGRDKALHHYPFDHYARWQADRPADGRLSRPGAFGENISTHGLLENDVCIGDRFRFGTSLIEISQGRQPCWKQDRHLEWPGLLGLMVKEGRSGWYYRVIEEGEADAHDEIELVVRPLPEWTVRRVFGLLIGGDHVRDRAALKTLAGMELLFDGWRQRAVALDV